MDEILKAIQKYFESTNNQVRIAVAISLIVITAIGLTQLNLAPDEGPCGPKEYIGQCFMIEKDVCQRTYTQINSECDLILKTMSLPPARLTFPIMKNCIDLKFSKMFTFIRTSGPYCDQRKQEVEMWSRTNPDF